MPAIQLNPIDAPGENDSLPLDAGLIARASKIVLASGQEALTTSVNALPGFVHDQTGVTSDFIPGSSIHTEPSMTEAARTDIENPPVVLDDRPFDFIEASKEPTRDIVNIAQQRIAASIMVEYEARNAQFEKAQKYVDFCNTKERLSEKEERTLPKAVLVLEKGPPMTMETAMEQALVRLQGGTTRL